MSVVQAQDPAAAGTVTESRAEQTARLLRLAASSAEPRRSQLQDEVVRLNLAVAHGVAHRYSGRGEPLDDLEQVAALGLVKAVRNFDAAQGSDFLSYAVPTIRGEVKRHFRDHAWMVRPPRRIQEIQPRIVAAIDLLSSRQTTVPSPADVADLLGEDTDNVVEAMTSHGCFHAASLDALLTPDESPTTSLHGVIGRHDGGFGLTETRADLEPALQQLSPRDRHILVRRVEDGWTQQQIADELAISQMQISRVLAQIRSRLHDALHDTAVA